MQQPTLISTAFASNGAKNTIPQTTTTLGKASLANGFPTETSMPINDGGVPPRREDFNGMLNWLSMFAMFQQSGGLFTYDSTVDYDPPSIVFYNGDLWWCLAANGPNTAVKTPSASNSTYWILLRDYLSNPLSAYPVGAYYISSVSTSPATLFGGTWVQVQDRVILAAGITYNAGTLDNPSTGGSSTKTLGVGNLPSHTHTFTTNNNGNHTHTVSGSTQNTSIAHTHTVSGTTGAGGGHTHTTGEAGRHRHGVANRRGSGISSGEVAEMQTSGGGYSPLYTDYVAAHNHSVSTVSNHTHSFSATTGSAGGSHNHTISITVGAAGNHNHTGTTNGTGNGTKFDIMPPYIVAYVWRRTA